MYEETFGLRKRPFGVTPDPGAFYTNRLYAEAEANLLYGIRERRGFMLLTGEVGTGKTTVLRRVMANLSGQTPFVLVFHTNLSFDEILAFVCHELRIDVPAPTRLARIEMLNEFLLEQTRRGRTTALLIDEAQNLTDEALEAVRLLSNLETDGEKLLQIVLAGQPELEARLDSPELRQLRQRIALRCRLERLPSREIGAYVRHRLQCAGTTRVDLFAPDAIVRIGIYSKGIPRLVNMICDNALLIAYAASRRTVSGEIITEVADDLRLRDPQPASGNDLLGLENALHQVECSVTREPRHAPPKTRDLAWAALLVALFGAAGVLATWSLRDDSGLRAWIPGVAADARGLGVETPALPATGAHGGDAEAAGESPAASLAPDESSSLPSRAVPDADAAPLAAAPDGAPARLSTLLYAVPSGTTAYEIAGAAYGSWCQLGLDLMAEANPEVRDLDWIAAGQRLRLPPLGHETLVRRASDGTSQIVLASYANPVVADRFAASAIRRSGYDVRVERRRVSGRVISHRVEIVGLPGAETEHALQAAAGLDLLPPPVPAFPDGLPSKGRANGVFCAASGASRGN